MKTIQSLKDNARRPALKIPGASLLFAACLLPVLAGCQTPLQRQDATGACADIGTLSLTVSGRSAARTIMPPETSFDDFVRFELVFAPYGGGGPKHVDWCASSDLTGGTGTLELGEGAWDLVVTAFILENGGEVVAARSGPDRIAVPGGGHVERSVVLLPVGGTGAFSWSIELLGSGIVAVQMEILLYPEMDTYRGPYCLMVGESPISLEGSAGLDAGQYFVVFTLSNGERNVLATEILRVYAYRTSHFRDSFSDYIFAVSLLYTILGAWNGGEWDFDGAGIEAGHFALLEIEGVDDGDGGFVAGILDWLNALAYNGGNPIVPDYAVSNVLEMLKALVDAALLGMAGEDEYFLYVGNYKNRAAAEEAIREQARNGTEVTITWTGDDRAVVGAGAYEVEIVFSDSFLMPAPITWTATPYGSPTTTAINFAFTANPGTLAAADFTIAAGTGSATRGILSNTRTMRILEISDVEAGSVSVSINRAGIAQGPQTVTLVAPTEPVLQSIANAVITVTAPVTGAIPNTTASGEGNFAVGAVSWSPSHSAFQGDTEYTATVVLTADTGSTFTGGLTGTVAINGQTATITNNTGAKVTLSRAFPATALTPIANAVITVTAPVTGAIPNTTASGYGNFSIGAVSWNPSHSAFQGDTEYTATVVLTANDGFTFAGGLTETVTVNGNPVTPAIAGDGLTATLSHTFAPTDPVTNPVSGFTIGFDHFVNPELDIDIPASFSLLTLLTTPAAIELTSPENYDEGSIRWILNNVDITDTAAVGGSNRETLTLEAPVPAGFPLRIGQNTLTITVRVGGTLYSRTVAFSVTAAARPSDSQPSGFAAGFDYLVNQESDTDIAGRRN